MSMSKRPQIIGVLFSLRDAINRELGDPLGIRVVAVDKIVQAEEQRKLAYQMVWKRILNHGK